MGQEMKQLSREAIEDYRQKLDRLKNVERLEVAQQIKEARAFGDISENAEYDAAMDHQARLEYEIVQLEELLAHVVEIDEESIDVSSVVVGTTVKIVNLETEEEETFQIVASSVADPFANKISNESPVGHALIGHSTGDVVEVNAPVGLINFKILEISK